MRKKILITGATGLIGKRLVSKLKSKHYEITIFSRDKEKGKREVPEADAVIEWDYNKPDEWQKFVDGKDAVVHLAGANLAGKRWDEEYKKLAYNSRVKSAKSLVEAIENAEKKPSVFITSSAVGYYGDRGNEELTEDSSPGNDFLAGFCVDWEKASLPVKNFGCRHSAIRTGNVLSTEEGPIAKMMLPFQLFIGGPLGSGDQWFPWIHMDDIVNIYEFVLENEIHGPVNAASPNQINMKQFAKALGDSLGRPSLFPVPKFAIKIVAGEIADAVTGSQKVIPKKLLENNYQFIFPEINSAIKDTLQK